LGAAGIRCVGVLEYWSSGVLEKSKPEIQLELALSILHHSITPLLQDQPKIPGLSFGEARAKALDAYSDWFMAWIMIFFNQAK
jgi:hypothetical protein